MRNTSQVNRQASVARILFAGFFGINKIHKQNTFRCTNKRIQYKIINHTKYIRQITTPHKHITDSTTITKSKT